MNRVATALIVRLGIVFIPAWIAAAVLAWIYLPDISGVNDRPLGGLVRSDAQAIQAEGREYKAFDSEILTRIAVVQRNPHGLSAAEQKRTLRRAYLVDKHRIPILGHIAFAAPILNTAGVFPSSREKGTTAVTFLYFKPEISANARIALAHSYAERARAAGDHVIGVTGPLPARVQEFVEIRDALPKVTLATIALIVLVLLIAFRAPGPALVTLAAAGIGYVIAIRLLAWLGEQRGETVPEDVEPIMLALLLGLVTDYALFFLVGMKRRLEAGDARIEAAGRVTRQNFPIILTAGLIVAVGSATLVVGKLAVFRSFGPGMALSVLVALAVSLTFVPGALALFGPALYWPGLRRNSHDEDLEQAARRPLLWRILTTRLAAAVVLVAVLIALAVAASGLRLSALGFTLIRGQQADSEVKLAAQAAALGFAPGIISPTEVLLEGSNLHVRLPRLAVFQAELAKQSGVAGVLGPREQLRRRQLPVFVNANGTAARLGVILEQDALSAQAIDILEQLQRDVPRLLDESGLSGVRVSYAGDTALAQETVDLIRSDVLRIGIVLLLVNFVLLALFLRAVVAPLFLIAASVLALAASLGVMTWFFRDTLGHQDITYYVPFAAAVLLLSLGSDYNVFVVGRIWKEAKTRSLREAIAVAMPRASRTITTAGITLAATFSLLAIIPIRPMRELAFVMCVGILLDAFVVRSLLVPSLLVLVGRHSWWPRTSAAPERSAPGVEPSPATQGVVPNRRL